MAVPPPFPDLPSPTDRAALRARLRAIRRDFAAGRGEAERVRAEASIEGRLTPLLRHGGVIAGYAPHRGEPDIMPFLLRALHTGHIVALPRIIGPGAMHFVRWLPDMPMAAGLAGIPQPHDEADPVEPAIVLAPLVGFDRAGRRLGQGGGYYDRWFAAHPRATRIGIAWSVQEVAALDAEAWDMPLHAIATEREWIEP